MAAVMLGQVAVVPGQQDGEVIGADGYRLWAEVPGGDVAYLVTASPDCTLTAAPLDLAGWQALQVLAGEVVAAMSPAQQQP
jgi:hypothetical protein